MLLELREGEVEVLESWEGNVTRAEPSFAEGDERQISACGVSLEVATPHRATPFDHESSKLPLNARATTIALWHIAKAALVRDFSERVLRGESPVNQPTPDSFSHWVASRLLS